MIRLTTVDGEYIWVGRDKIIAITQATEINKMAGKLMPILGQSKIFVLGLPPLAVKGSPAALAEVLAGAGNAGSFILTA